MTIRSDNRAENQWRLRLRNARLAMHLTQRELAERLGKSKSAVQAWEPNGKNEPSIGDALALAEILCVPVAWLMFGEAPPVTESNLRLRHRLREFEREIALFLEALDGRPLTNTGESRRRFSWRDPSARKPLEMAALAET